MFHTTYRVKDSRMVTAGEERSDAAEVTTLWLHGPACHAAAFRGRADLESIRSLNRSDATDSDHSLDAREFLRLRFGPWPRTPTTRPSFKYSCSNGSTAPRTWPDSTSSRSNQHSLRIWRLCAGGAASGARGVSGSTCTRPSRWRRSSSRNGSIARGAADTCSARERSDRLWYADTFARAARSISARSYNSANRQGLAPCNEWRLS